MITSIEYRGPDEAGEYLGNDVHLGVVRLAIIDIKGGRQPVTASGDRTVAVYNGEIYNYQELRRQLRQRGHSLPNECDSTVIPHLYEEKGEKLLEDVHGMFAFGLWDARERKLFLARDRLGIKPLYLAQTRDYLLFASEIKALLASGLVEAAIDKRSVDDLFSLSYPCPPRTMFRGIEQLLPAHCVSVRAGHQLGRAQRYWRVPFPHRGEHRRGRRRDLEEELREKLKRAIYDHLQADVRVGAYLSGGLDSSAIATLVREVTGDSPTTFTIGFSSPEHDERHFAAAMSETLHGKSHAIVCDSTTASFFPEMIWHTEMPLQYPLALPLMQLSALARSEGFPVILTGEGADELMGGYDCFRAQKMRRALDRRGLRTLRPHVYQRLYKWLGAPDGAVDKMLEIQSRSIPDVTSSFLGVYPAWYDAWQALDVDRDLLLSPDGRRVRPADEAPLGFSALVREDIGELAPLDAQLAIEVETRLPSWILLIGDRAGMANGVETRVPFLDDEIVAFIASLEPSMKMSGFTEKAILRGAMKDLLPNAIRCRQKRPFYTPVKDWFFGRNSPEYVSELIGEPALRDAGLFAPEVAKKFRQDLSRVPENHIMRHQLEWLLVLVLGTQLLHALFVKDSLLHRPLPALAQRPSRGIT